MPQRITTRVVAVQDYSALHREITRYLNHLFFSQGNTATNKKHGAWAIQISVWCEVPQCQQHRITPKYLTIPSPWKSTPDAGAALVLTVPSSSEYSPDQKLKVLLSNWYRRDFSNVSESMICPNSHGTCVVVLYTRLWKRERNFKLTSSVLKGRSKTDRSMAWQMLTSHPRKEKNKQTNWKTPQENKYSKVLVCDVPNLQSMHNCQTRKPSCLLTHF